jgi:hypothetical protein
MKNPMPSFPRAPVDGYRVEWWRCAERGLVHYHAIYHVNSKWSDVCPSCTRTRAKSANSATGGPAVTSKTTSAPIAGSAGQASCRNDAGGERR